MKSEVMTRGTHRTVVDCMFVCVVGSKREDRESVTDFPLSLRQFQDIANSISFKTASVRYICLIP